MAESQEDIYVRRDVFEARMDRMEMLLEKTVLEIKSYVDKSTGETKAYVEKATADTRAYVEKATADTRAYVEKTVSEIKAQAEKNGNDIKALTVRVDALEKTLGARISAVESTLSWWIGLFAILIALLAFATPIADSIKKLFKPSFTLDDIKNIVRAEIASQSGGGE